MSASTGASKETADAAAGAATASSLPTDNDADAPTTLFVTAVVCTKFAVNGPLIATLPPVITKSFVNVTFCTGITRITGNPQIG
jgi:hypothetical protein